MNENNVDKVRSLFLKTIKCYSLSVITVVMECAHHVKHNTLQRDVAYATLIVDDLVIKLMIEMCLEEWKLSVRRRESACPIDNCAAHLEEYVFYPCGLICLFFYNKLQLRCIIAHIFKSDENPKSLIGTRCPYKLCQIQIIQVIKIYIT